MDWQGWLVKVKSGSSNADAAQNDLKEAVNDDSGHKSSKPGIYHGTGV